MEKFTAIIPTGNEAHNIKDVIKTVDFADEILVVDSFSNDGTFEVAQELADVVIQRKFDFHAAQKNWAIPQASYDWILLLDADERLTSELKDEIVSILSQKTDKVAYWIPRSNEFMGHYLKYSGIQGDRCIRLFRKSKCRYDDKLVHEEIVANGLVGQLEHRMLHHTFISLEHYRSKIDNYSLKQAQDCLEKQNKVSFLHIYVKPFVRFVKHFIFGAGFLDGYPGYQFALSQSYGVKMRYVHLRRLLRQTK